MKPVDSEHVMPLSIIGGNQAISSSSYNVSRETSLNSTATDPQGCHIHVDIVKSASASSQPLASSGPSPTSNTANSNGPVQRESTEIIASPPPKEEQISASALAKLNIKVRDFAFEGTLPPIAPFCPTLHPPLQVQAAPRLLKRPRQEYGLPENDPFLVGLSQPVAGPSRPAASASGHDGLGTKKSKPLERENTAPIDPNLPPPPSRERGYADLSQYQSTSVSQSQPPTDISSSPRTPARLAIGSQSQNPWNSDYSSQSQPLPQFEFSQESEPYIDTPLVTPNGSLQWPADIDIESISDSQMDTESQMPVPEIITYSQLGFSPLQSQMDNPSQILRDSSPMPSSTLRFQTSPLSAPPSSPLPRYSRLNASPGPSTEPSCPPASSLSPRNRSPRRPKENKSPYSAPLRESLSPPRYNFRKRHAPPSSPSPLPPAQRVTRSGSRPPQPKSTSRPPQFSMQAAQVKSKRHSSESSPRAKIRKLRTTSSVKASGRGHKDRMITG